MQILHILSKNTPTSLGVNYFINFFFLWLSSQLSLSLISTLSHLQSRSASPSSSAEISRATDWVRSASLGGEWVGNADQPFRSNNPFGNRDDDGELIGHGGRVGQSCCDYDCDCVVVVVIVVVEDRWISGRILLLWKIGESLLLLLLLLWLLLWKIGELVVGFCWRVAGWVWVWMEKTRWWVWTEKTRGKEIIKNVKRMNILLNKCVE